MPIGIHSKNDQMKKASVLTLLLIILLPMAGCRLVPDSLADIITGPTRGLSLEGNSLFHQPGEVHLKHEELRVEGEIKEPGTIRLRDHYEREVVVRQALPDASGQILFTGAYRYQGYSLFDLLNSFNQQKKNMEAFRPPIDLYVIIENDLGESVAFSWSEIFHTSNPHQIIVATRQSPIYPHRNEVEYPEADTWKIVASGDLFAHRYLDNPSRIMVRSFDQKDYPIDRELAEPFSEQVVVAGLGEEIILDPLQAPAAHQRYQAVFYGMGMGYHPTPEFKGPYLTSLLEGRLPENDPERNRQGLVVFAGKDGYRAVFSYSELFNRADQVKAILAIPDDPESGYYRIFHPADFYADRSVKNLSEIYFFNLKGQ